MNNIFIIVLRKCLYLRFTYFDFVCRLISEHMLLCQFQNCIYLQLRSYDYNMHVEELQPADLSLVILLSSEQIHNLKDSACNTFETSSKNNLIDNNTEANSVNSKLLMFKFPTFVSSRYK